MSAQYEIIVGRGGQQPFIIPGSCGAVSHEHARFWVDQAGNWIIEDIKGPAGNGTYVMDAQGEFRSVRSKMIDRETIIRLGPGGHNSFTFYANRFIEPEDFSFEFDLLESKLGQIKQEQMFLETENEKKQARVKNLRMVGGVLTIAMLVGGYILGGVGGAMPSVVVGALTGLLPGPDTKALKALEKKKRALLVCPQCFLPISEANLYNHKCPSCKAHGK